MSGGMLAGLRSRRPFTPLIGLVVATCLLFWLSGPPPAGLPISGALFGLAAVTAARVVVRPKSWLTLVLVSWTFAVAGLALTSEALSLAGWLGSPVAWVSGAGAWAIGWEAARTLTGRGCPSPWPRSVSWRALAGDLGLPSWAMPWLLAFVLQLTTAWVLTWFAGINVYDSISTYLPRSVRYLQDGSFSRYSTLFDTTPYLHQTIVAYQLVFLRSDVLVNATSFVCAIMIGLTLYETARSLGWHGYLPLVAAGIPFTMPLFLLHASTSNFDILEGLWLVLALYFLRRGAPGLQRRWLLCAAISSGLALATKPTFWFAAPGLGLIWLATFARSYARRGAASTLRTMLVCAGLVLVVGAPYLMRNAMLRGSPFGADPLEGFVLGPPLSLVERARRVLFTELALWTQLLTPPFLFGQLANEPVNAWFKGVATALGYELPDQRWSFYGSWDAILRHGIERYTSGHASYGVAFVAVVVPSIVALVWRWRHLGPRRLVLGVCVAFSLLYTAVLAALFRYDVSYGRYLIEAVVVLAVAAPTSFAVLPRRLAAGYGLLISAVLILEMRDVILNNRQMPPTSVTITPREEQYYRYFGQSLSMVSATRTFAEKYPVDRFPDVYVDVRGGPGFPDYGFLGPSLSRRTHYWSPAGVDPPIPPGVFLTQDAGVVNRLASRPEVSIDRLSLTTWVIIPNDRLTVVFSLRKPTTGGALILDVRAAMPPTLYDEPDYRFSLLCPTGSCLVRDFSPDPLATIPLDTPSVVRVEARDRLGRQPPQVLDIEPRQYLGL